MTDLTRPSLRDSNPPVNRLPLSFLLVWIGQLFSMTGSGLTSFGLGVWLYQQTGSVLAFSGLILFATLPALLVMPWAGSVADRYSKRKIMLLADATSATCTATIGLLIWLQMFSLWHFYLLLTIASSAGAFQRPAAFAAITSLVKKNQFGRVSGMLALSSAIAQFSAPLMAATLLGMISLHGIIVVDLLTFIVGATTLIAAKFPAVPPPTHKPNTSKRRKTLLDLTHAYQFFQERPAMAMVYAYVIAGAFLSGMVAVLVTPMVLLLYDENILALIYTSGAVGALTGGLIVSIWGGPARWTIFVLFFTVFEGLAVAVAGVTTSVVGLCLCAFIIFLSGTMLSSCVESLSRRKVPLGRQGSVIALTQLIAMSAMPFSAVFGGVLVHYFFEPALMPGGILFNTVGTWFGTGEGRGAGFFFFLVGSLVTILALLSMTNTRLQHLEANVPDAS